MHHLDRINSCMLVVDLETIRLAQTSINSVDFRMDWDNIQDTLRHSVMHCQV